MKTLYEYIKTVLYIIEGYFKWLYDSVFDHMSEKSIERYEICKNCEFRKDHICGKCGCVIKAKVRVDYMTDEEGKSIDGCPMRKW